MTVWNYVLMWAGEYGGQKSIKWLEMQAMSCLTLVPLSELTSSGKAKRILNS